MDTTKYFKTHPSATEVYQTSDGYLFAKECDAKNHAKTLTNKSVKKVTPKSEAAEKENPQANKVEGDKTQNPDSDGTPAGTGAADKNPSKNTSTKK